MRFYIASGLENRERVASIVALLSEKGHLPTYDWTQFGDVRGNGVEAMSDTAAKEALAVKDAEFVLIMLPGGSGTHTELGVALASRSNKRIVIWSKTGEEFTDPKKTCVFYFHSSVTRLYCEYEELITYLNENT